jgi:hypothetical protein
MGLWPPGPPPPPPQPTYFPADSSSKLAKTTLCLSPSSLLGLGTDVHKGGTPEELESRVQTSSSGTVFRKASSGALRTFQSRYVSLDK